MSKRSIGFIGSGRVARILLMGWTRSGYPLPEVVASDIDARSPERLTADYSSVRNVGSDIATAAGRDVVFLAVHPPVVADVVARIQGALKPDATLVSLAPKFTIEKLAGMLGGFSRIARMIPNAASAVGKGFNPISYSAALTAQDRMDLGRLLRGLGEMPEVEEGKLEAYAILTAMGPTYFWPQLYELRSLANEFGLDADAAANALSAMMHGTLAMMTEAGLNSEEVQDLIPVKPLAELQPAWLEGYRTRLRGVLEKIRP